MTRTLARAIVDLLPRYLRARRVGFKLPSDVVESIEIPDYVLLRGVASEIDALPIGYAELRANLFNPYNIVVPILDRLPRLVKLGLLEQTGDAYSLTPAGRGLLTRVEHSANDYAAGRMRLPNGELQQLAAALYAISEQLRQAPEPENKAHQERIARLRRFDDRDAPAVQLEYALYGLWMARDDAHNAAWRAAGFRGPPFDLLSRVWAGDASTVEGLVELTRDSLRPEDIAALLDELERAGYIVVTLPDVALTGHGREVRAAIEQETDRVYFAPWPDLDTQWLRDRLQQVVDALE